MNARATIMSLVKKNLRVLIRARTSALIVILGPLLVVFIAGLAFDNTNLFAVKIGAYSENYNDVSNSFLDRLSQKQFKVTRFPDQIGCTQGVLTGEVHTCVVFSPDFTIAQSEANEITFHVDYAQINLVWSLLNVMTERVGEQSSEISRNLTAVLINALEFSSQQARDRKANLINLTTVNDEIGRRITDVSVRLEEVDLSFDPNAFLINDLQSQKNKVKHWVDNSLEVGKEALGESQSYIDAVYESVQGSGLSGETKAQLQAMLEDTLEDVALLQERLEKTEELVVTENQAFQELVDKIAGKITQTKSRLDFATKERDFALGEARKIRQLLDASLKNLLNVQRSLNNIERVIGAIQVTDPEAIVQPIVTNIKPVISEQSYLNYVFPTLIVLVIMFTAILLATTLITLERSSIASFRNFMVPAKPFTFVVAIFASCFFILSLQVIVILSIASIFFSSQILGAFIATLILLVLLIAVFVLLGMTLGYVFNSEETATLGAISVGSLLLFLSDVIIPIERMPRYIGRIAEFNPVVIGGDLLRSSILYDIGMNALFGRMVILVIYIVVLSLICLYVYYASQQRKLKLFTFFRKQ